MSDKLKQKKRLSDLKRRPDGDGPPRTPPSSESGHVRNLSDWTWNDVKGWLEVEGFPEFWPFLEPHKPTGIDLLMLTPDDWQTLLREGEKSSPNTNQLHPFVVERQSPQSNGHRCPSVVQVNRLFYKVNRLKLSFGLPQKLPKLNFCLSGNPIALSVGNKSLVLKHPSSGESHSTDEELDLELLSNANHVHRKSSPIPGNEDPVDPPPDQEVHSNGFAHKFDQAEDENEETDLEDEEEDGVVSFAGLTVGPCPFCNHQIKREKAQILPERWKALLAFVYALGVSWVTAFVMVIVHDRVPDMEKYPPLPDILLDNIPHIPWAFEMCEFTGMILISLWCLVLLFHKHRFVLMRRFFSISGTIFLLRCVTMLITSLSVPGKHLDCSPRPYGDIWNKLYNAYVIWTGAGMTLQGVRTCGDYMFSGHTVALTLLNFFITEYTSRKIYFLHTLTWICNVFGIFFILAAHEHYSIDVFVAFYITSRLFMYYHTLANQPVLHNMRKKSTPTLGHFSYDAHRVWLWFPMFSFFESKIDGKIPNEFEWPISIGDITGILEKVLSVIRLCTTKAAHMTGMERVKEAKDIIDEVNQHTKKERNVFNGYSKTKKLKKK